VGDPAQGDVAVAPVDLGLTGDVSGQTSAQSMSSSGGPAKAIVSRTASTPCSSSWSLNCTMLPFDFDIADPSISTMPWLSSALKGSVNETRPRSKSTFVMNRA
jgi:hypothetical protein